MRSISPSPSAFFPQGFDGFFQAGNGEPSRRSALIVCRESHQQPIATEQFLDHRDRLVSVPKAERLVVGTFDEAPGFGFPVVDPIFDFAIVSVSGSNVASGLQHYGGCVFATANEEAHIPGRVIVAAPYRFVGVDGDVDVRRVFELRGFLSNPPFAGRCCGDLDLWCPPAFSVVTGQPVQIVVDRHAFLGECGAANQACGKGSRKGSHIRPLKMTCANPRQDSRKVGRRQRPCVSFLFSMTRTASRARRLNSRPQMNQMKKLRPRAFAARPVMKARPNQITINSIFDSPKNLGNTAILPVPVEKASLGQVRQMGVAA